MDNQQLTLKEVALTSTDGKVAYSPYGYIIDGEGNIHALTSRWFHGVVTAILYPEVAEKHGIGVPRGPVDEVDVFAYQRFEHDCAYDLPILRIAISTMTDSVMVSKGGIPATDAQIEAMRRTFAAIGRQGRDTLTGEEGDMTVAEYLENLRAEREKTNE